MRILIVKLSSIGDVVHTLPATAMLRKAMPGAKLAWVVDRRASAILKDSPVIDELIEIDARAWRKRLMNHATIDDVRSRLNDIRGMSGSEDKRVDIAIDFQGLIKSGLVALASGAGRRVGFETSELREKASRLFLTEQVSTSGFKHVIEKNIALALAALSGEAGPTASLPFSTDGFEFPINVSASDEQYAADAVERCGGRFAIINPGGGWPTKLWPAQRYGQLADWIWKERGLVSVVTYGPGEESLAEEVAASSETGRAHPLALTLKQFAALARRADIFVGGDTGPLHIAAACATPIVGIYGPTSPDRNGPFSERDITVGRDLWCRAECHRRSCWHWECMNISVSVVAQAVARRLDRKAVD